MDRHAPKIILINALLSQNAVPVTSKNFEKVFEVFIDSFSGATGGFCASLMLYPIENLRTRL